MKGHKAVNGNYITGKEIEQAKRKFKKEKAESLKRREEENRRQELINIAKGIAFKEQQKLYQQKQKEISTIKDKIILALRENNPFTYKQYLIIWDIITTNYDQILSDIIRGRITKNEIKRAVQYVEQFSSDIIGVYWKDRLITD